VRLKKWDLIALIGCTFQNRIPAGHSLGFQTSFKCSLLASFLVPLSKAGLWHRNDFHGSHECIHYEATKFRTSAIELHSVVYKKIMTVIGIYFLWRFAAEGVALMRVGDLGKLNTNTNGI
jgi:hypothetical protein